MLGEPRRGTGLSASSEGVVTAKEDADIVASEGAERASNGLSAKLPMAGCRS